MLSPIEKSLRLHTQDRCRHTITGLRRNGDLLDFGGSECHRYPYTETAICWATPENEIVMYKNPMRGDKEGATMSSTTRKGWPRNSYTGPGGGLYTGLGGGAYTGLGGGAYTGLGGGAYTGLGGGLYTGPGGGLYTGPGGGLYTGPGGGLYTGPGGGLYTGPDGGLYTGPDGGLSTSPGGGLYAGPDPNPYYSNTPPRKVFLEYLRTHFGYEREYLVLKKAWGL